MRLIGLLGGLSWESTAVYYRLMNQDVAARLGGLHSARVLIHSFDFSEIAELQAREDWAQIGARLATAAATLEAAGAEVILLGTNTLHYVAPAIMAAIRVPFLHIADPTGEALRHAGVRRAGFLGTRYSMELPFWKDHLMTAFGIELVMPPASARALVHRVIYEELCVGRIEDESRIAYSKIIDGLRANGAEAVVLGCTEIGLLIGAADSSLPIFDTAALHAAAAVEWSLAGGGGAGRVRES